MSIDALCTDWLGDQEAGLAVLVIQGAKVVHKQGYGLADVDAGLAPDASTIFDLASVSKHFTAMAVMLLAERGELSYDDPLSTFLEFPEPAASITIRQLLHHTSGLKDYFSLWEDSEDDWSSDEDSTSASVVAALAREEDLDNDPGAAFDYSNSGYVVLAEIVGAVSGKPFPAFMRDEFFRPLGMTRTYVNDGSRDADANQAVGYEEGAPFEATPLDNAYGDGAVRSTLDDLARWNAALDGHQIVSNQTQSEAWQAGTTNDGETTGYGFGWFVSGDDDEGQWANHSGSYGGFETYYTKDFDNEISVIVLSNFAEAKPDELGDAIVALLAS